MSRCFRVLGLSEKATKAQVEEAYRRKVARYKGPDYQEEPEYANRKLMELRGVYEEALRLARTGDASSSTKRLKPSTTERPVSKSLSSSRMKDTDQSDEEHGFSEKFHQWLEKRDDHKTHRKNTRSKRQENRKGTGFFSELKGFDADKAKAAWQKVKSDLQGVTQSLTTENKKNSPVNKRQKEKPNGSELFSLIVMLLIAGFTLFGSCGDDSISMDDLYSDSGYDYILNYDEVSETDRAIQGYASSANSLLYANGKESSSVLSESNGSEYIEEANQFAKNYWNMESINEVSNYLYYEYSEYGVDDQSSLDVQLDYIFEFYGFLSLEEAVWYFNPYTNEVIHDYGTYLSFLNQYHDEMNL